MNILNEAFASKKLAVLAKQHGGIDISRNGGIRDGAKAFFGGSSVDVSRITDDMLSGEPFEYDYLRTPDRVSANLIHFKDGYAISLKPYDLRNSDNINPAKPRRKPSRYGTGIGDTGDHDKRESPFFKNGKKDVGPEYNGFGVSSRAGESQHYREAIKNNKNDIKYYEEHPDGEYSKNAINRAKKNIQTIKGYGKELLNKRKNESKNMKKSIIKENLNNFYSEEDSNGKIGQVGQVKSYDCGYMTESNVEIEAKESGYQSIEEYLKSWWNEVSTEIPFTWETLGKGYGYHGNDIFTQVEPDGGILHCKEIFGQIMFDVYPPQQNEAKKNKQTIKLNESELKKIVAESVKIVLKESFIGGDNQFGDNVAQKAQSPSDVFRMNYWTGRTESKGNGELVLRCYTDNNSMATRNYPDFEKVVNDLNQYYKLHGSKSIATAMDEFNGEPGEFLRINKSM